MKFDDAVIGSSPLMLLQAFELASQGRSVCVIDQTKSLGGAWQLQNFGSNQDLEIACHVIEYFPNVYETLSRSSGVEFEELEPQPVRLHKSGFSVPYHSRTLVLLSGMRMIVGYLPLRLRQTLKLDYDHNALINFRQKLSSYFRFQLSSLFKSATLKGPHFGFADFLQSLICRCEEKGVRFFTLLPQEIQRKSGRWRLCALDQRIIDCERIFASTSVSLKHDKAGLFLQGNTKTARRQNLVVGISLDHVAINQTYVAFWGDPVISRISRIDERREGSGYQKFLLELRYAVTSEAEAKQIARDKLISASIILGDAPFDYLGKIECEFASNEDQLEAGEIDKNFFALHSSGNLAAGIARWLKHQ